jgi:hypothetical protein
LETDYVVFFGRRQTDRDLLPRLDAWVRGALVMVVEKTRELLAQRFVTFAMVAEHDRALEQAFLKVARKLAPRLHQGFSQHRAKPRLIVSHRHLSSFAIVVLYQAAPSSEPAAITAPRCDYRVNGAYRPVRHGLQLST